MELFWFRFCVLNQFFIILRQRVVVFMVNCNCSCFFPHFAVVFFYKKLFFIVKCCYFTENCVCCCSFKLVLLCFIENCYYLQQNLFLQDTAFVLDFYSKSLNIAFITFYSCFYRSCFFHTFLLFFYRKIAYSSVVIFIENCACFCFPKIVVVAFLQ